MTPNQIAERVTAEADARLPETVERLFSISEKKQFDTAFDKWWTEEQQKYQPIRTYKEMVKVGWDACAKKFTNDNGRHPQKNS